MDVGLLVAHGRTGRADVLCDRFFSGAHRSERFYSCRGLWAILLVAFLGRRMGLREGNASRSTQIRRAIGAGLLVLGIYLTPMGGD